MVISVVAAEYKIERVLIDQGSSANILYRRSSCRLAGCRSALGTCTVLQESVSPSGGRSSWKLVLENDLMLKPLWSSILVVDAPASYNIIIGRPILNRLQAVVSTKHLCTKFLLGRRVGSMWADSQSESGACTPVGAVKALDLDLDPRGRYEHEGPHPVKDLKEVQLGFRPGQTTKIGTTMNLEEENLLVIFLKANHDVFAWSTQDMPGVDPDFICHRLSIERGAKPIAQKKRKQGEEKREVVREETCKLLSARFVREV
ncbi:hypothetical protein CR513_48951, partial [Mucuna pruriens]